MTAETKRHNEEMASDFCASIIRLANNMDNLNNLELYLRQHFSEWLKKYASTPEGITEELKAFSNMDI